MTLETPKEPPVVVELYTTLSLTVSANPTYAWSVYLYYGNVYNYPKTTAYQGANLKITLHNGVFVKAEKI